MAIFTSEKREINSTPEKLFNFLGELENLGLIQRQKTPMAFMIPSEVIVFLRMSLK